MLYGSRTPTHHIADVGAYSDGEKAVELLRRAGRNCLGWQADVLNDWLAMNDGNTWANTVNVLHVPRQNGKTCDAGGLIAWCMTAYGSWCVYTSHLQKTSTETFEELSTLFESRALSKYVKTIKTALGREEIVLTNGARCKFLARTRNGGRGQHGDIWVCDEYQELTDEQQGSFLPLLSASRNPMTVYMGTPPDANAPGEVYYRLRKDALSGKRGMSFNEWGVSEIGDVTDESRWYATNPSLGKLIRIDTVRAECSQMPRDMFARERLGYVMPGCGESGIIKAEQWDALQGDMPSDGVDSYGVKFSPDGSRVALSVCRKNDDTQFVELLFDESTNRGTGWLSEWIFERKSKCALVAVDGKAGSKAFAEKLSAVMPSKSVYLMKTDDAVSANSSLLSAVNEKTLIHAGQQQLRDSATKSVRRKIGNEGGFGFADGQAPSAPIESTALALWAANHTRRKPGRKQVMA